VTTIAQTLIAVQEIGFIKNWSVSSLITLPSLSSARAICFIVPPLSESRPRRERERFSRRWYDEIAPPGQRERYAASLRLQTLWKLISFILALKVMFAVFSGNFRGIV
jgi:hypothetical protein